MKKDTQVNEIIARFLKRKFNQYPDIDQLASRLTERS